MFRKAVSAASWVTVAASAVIFFLYLANSTPVPPAISTSDAASGAKPFVVKMHARWCPICMTTTGIWSEIERTYVGRVNLLVFDFTNEGTTDRSRVEAKRLGLEAFFDEYAGTTGSIVVLDRRTRQVSADIHGRRPIAEYHTAIEAALQARSE